MLRRSTPSRLLFLLLLVVACSDSPADPEDPSPAVCQAALGSSTAQPFDRVEVTGLDGLDGDSWVEFETEAGTTGVSAVLVDGEGRARIMVPPNPDNLMNGGSLNLTLTDGTTECAGLALDVAPIPAASGDPVGEVATAVEGLAQVFADRFGLDTAMLATTSLGDLPPQAVPVALLLEALEGFDPATVLGGLEADEAAFVQALTAKLGLASTLNAILDEETATSASLARSDTLAGSAWGAEAGEPAALPPSLALDGCTSLGAVPKDLLGIDDAETLSGYIKAARGAGDTFGPLGDLVVDFGAAFAVMGLAVPQVGAVAGWAAFVTNLVRDMRANLYPSALTRLEYQLEHARIEEDWDTERGDPEIRWSFAKLWATNNGMGLARVGLDLITTRFGLPSGFKSAVASKAVGGLDVVGKEALNRRLNELQQDPDGGAECWGIGVTEFGPALVGDDTGEKWVRAELVAGDAISIDASDIRKLTPDRIGTATLRVRTQEDPFPGPFAYQDKPVEVLRKEVVWIPSTLTVENPGETVTIKFRVDNSRHNGPEDVQVAPGPELGQVPTPTYSGGVHSIDLQTPSEREAYATYIDASSTSKELPPETPARKSRLDIFANESVTISPAQPPCVGPGASQTLTAVATGPGEVTVAWAIEAGSGTLSATTGESVAYTAPSTGSGEVTVRAYLAENPEVEDRVTFRYGQCNGLAAYYAVLTEIGFPFLPGGECSNPDLDQSFSEVTAPEDGLDPTVPPDPAHLWIDRSETLTKSFSDAGTFGDKPAGSDVCTTAFFSAEAGYDGTITGSADGTRLDLDIDTFGESYCEDMGELGEQCSTAGATMGVIARFDFDIAQAASYLLTLELSCDSYQLPDFPQPVVSVIPIRVAPDGTYLDPNETTQPIQVECGPDNPTVSLSQIFEFEAPAADGQVDHVMVYFEATNMSFGAAEGVTEGRHTGYLRGFVSVEPQ